jgi:hypothetical protein
MWSEFKVYWEGARRTTADSDGGDVWYEKNVAPLEKNVAPVQEVGGAEATVDEDETDVQDDKYRHLHMLFITRNPVLRHQVGATFSSAVVFL